ncbi:MAG: NUDIX domain-containing protein [Acidobacteriota bacterium]|nr:NUDIX domain-containing protein [Acidobacteriota bacterium]
MTDYPKPSLTVDAVVLAGLGPRMKLLVIERAKPPFQGRFALPGGFVDPYELPPNAVVRELIEETGLQLKPRQAVPLTLRTREGRDPRGWTLSQPFLFHLPQPLPVKGGDDAVRAEWVPLSDLSSPAFDHGAILCEALGKFWPEMPMYDPRLADIPVYGRGPLGDHLTFFGGSFNPWHQGHEACLALCPRKEGLVVVPDSNPFKKGEAGQCSWRLFRELVERAEHFGALVFPGFCGMEGANPTIAWLPYVKARTKGFLIGEDSFTSFPGWNESITLAQALNHLYVAPRRVTSDQFEAARDWFKAHAPSLQIHFLDDHHHRDVSSTALRKQQASKA